MSVSESKKRANRKWDKDNMITLGCKVYRFEADIFKEFAATTGQTANTLLKEYVRTCNEEYLKSIGALDDDDDDLPF